MIQVKKMDSEAVLPAKSDSYAAGYDLSLLQSTTVQPGAVVLLRTGISALPPTGSYLRINGRSGLTSRGFLVQPGVIDCDYTGEIFVVMYNSTPSAVTFEKDARIAQMIPEQYVHRSEVREVERLVCAGERRDRAFGSSGV